MSELQYHPAVKARVKKLGKKYQKLQVAGFRTLKEIPAFSDRIGPGLQQFMDYNNQILHLLDKEKMPEHLLKHQIDTSDAMGALGKRFSPMFYNLVFGSRPKLDRILRYGDTLTRELHALHALRHQKEASETLTAKLEKETEALVLLHTEVRQLLNDCINTFQETQNILKRSLN